MFCLPYRWPSADKACTVFAETLSVVSDHNLQILQECVVDIPDTCTVASNSTPFRDWCGSVNPVTATLTVVRPICHAKGAEGWSEQMAGFMQTSKFLGRGASIC